MMKKYCFKCKTKKDSSNFHNNHRTKDGLSCYCKGCRKQESSLRYIKNRDHILKTHRKYKQNNKDKEKLRWAKYSAENAEKLRLKAYEKYHKDINKSREISKKSYLKNRDKILEYHRSQRESRRDYYREYVNKRRNTDINYKLRMNIRSRIYNAITGRARFGSAIKYLGCSIDELKRHLETKFTNGMRWKNYGKWHIDHIRPLINFDLTKEIEFYEAVNYKNLQPLWESDNLSKGKK